MPFYYHLNAAPGFLKPQPGGVLREESVHQTLPEPFITKAPVQIAALSVVRKQAGQTQSWEWSKDPIPPLTLRATNTEGKKHQEG